MPVRTLHDHPAMTARRRSLRRTATPAEASLWQMLRRRQAGGWRFRRQHSVGRYVLDFYCPALRLAVEVDGAIHTRPNVAAYDAVRTAWLENLGIQVVRIPNHIVLRNPAAVAQWLGTLSPLLLRAEGPPCFSALNALRSGPPPKTGGGGPQDRRGRPYQQNLGP